MNRLAFPAVALLLLANIAVADDDPVPEGAVMRLARALDIPLAELVEEKKGRSARDSK